MNGPARCAFVFAIAFFAANQVFGQVNLQPTAEPVVSAQNEAWYLNGEPVTYAGNIYYPAGPHVYFNRNEMVRSGVFKGVPLYTRTTIEPYSIVFVPIGRSLMQPYERLRDGDLAGTVGSTTPSFPVVTPSEQANQRIPQAPAPPVAAGQPAIDAGPPAVAPVENPEPRPVATSGTRRPTIARRPLRTAERPKGLNVFYIDFDGTRYFSQGAPMLIGNGRFEQIGNHHALPVYIRDTDRTTIYVPIQRGADLLARYCLREP